MEEGFKSKTESWIQEDDVIYDAIPISYAYPVDNTNEGRPSTSKRKRRTTKKSYEKLSDDWIVREKPRIKEARVDKTYYHKTDHITVRSEVSALYYQKYKTLPPKKSKKGKEKKSNSSMLNKTQGDYGEEKKKEKPKTCESMLKCSWQKLTKTFTWFDKYWRCFN